MTFYVEDSEYAGGYQDAHFYRPATADDITDDMVERAARVHADWEGLDHQDSIREQARAMLVAAFGDKEKP
jgi:hypothetical protein